MGTYAAGGVFLLTLQVLAVATAAQAKLDLPAGALEAGSTVKIGLTDPANAGRPVVVVLDGGGYPAPVLVKLVIKLDARGRGVVQWQVPEWDGVRVNAPGATEVTRPIVRRR